MSSDYDHESEDDDSMMGDESSIEELSFVPKPPAKTTVNPRAVLGSKAKNASSKLKSTKTPASVLAPKENFLNATKTVPATKESNVVGSKSGISKSKTVEEIYQKKSQLEHILLRPDTYIGSTQRDSADMYVLANERIVLKTISYTPGLYKIFDEIVVNAADNKQRDPNMDKMDIAIDASTNTISVKNNGQGIPIVVHKDHRVYVPTLIFGHLLTGSNFDDDEKKTTGGRNGYGAKLANVFSTRFEVEIVDSTKKLKFHQVFRNNMAVADEPIIKNCTASEIKAGNYVKICFCPDLIRFGMDELDDDTVALLSKRAYDIAGTMASRPGKKLVVTLNEETLPIKSFKDYLALFDGLEAPAAFEKTERWEVGVAPSLDASPHQVSFVNAICTSKGGGHVTYIADQVANFLVKVLKKKSKKEVKPAQIKNHLTIYVNCLVENPTFDSQTKDFLTSKPKVFGSKCDLPEKFLKAIEKSAIVTTIDSYLSFREREALKRKGGTKKIKLTGILKLDDANFAGTAKSRDCTLIITEGDSAKSLAMAGLSVVGRDYYGVFPLRGKPLNVRDSPLGVVTKNEEIKNLVDIMGLKFNVCYDEDNLKTLRYGHLMIMADQDTDGSHIKGLIINFIHHFWPSLLDVPGFLQQFITPIVKASKGKRSKSFFSLPEYKQWLESTGNNGKGYKLKYYKGLGTSTSAEAKEYFSALDLHEVKFGNLSLDETYPEDNEELEDGNPAKKVTSGADLIDLVFRKDRVNDRKKWLGTFSKETFLDYREVSENGELRYSDFINKEYIIFSNYDNERSIPNIMDGFKPSQRKVLFACLKRKLKNEIKVAQLTGYVAEHSAYHHGEASLQQTIVGLAQNFVGSNNINLLTPSGQFGTRRMGGKDAASPRYIFTCLEPITRAIFHPDDDDLLSYLNDDGVSIEPEYYVPVIPMVLVNGSDGIGTGYSSAVSNYNPREIINNLRRKLNGEIFEPMTPYYYGFNGEILPDDKKDGTFKVIGKIERFDDNTLLITELPLKKWTQDYKQFLETMLTGSDKQPAEIKDFKENHTESTVRFTVVAEKQKIDEFDADKMGLMGKFKLSGSISTTNMNLFDPDKRMVKYGSPDDIMTEFFSVRLEYYVKRKTMLVAKLERERSMLWNKARFVEEVCKGSLIINNRKRGDLLSDLQTRGYNTFFNESKKKNSSEASDNDSETDSAALGEVVPESDLGKGFEYLLGMKIWSLTFEKAEAIRAQLAEKTSELKTLQNTAPEQLWSNDLDAIEAALDHRDVEFELSVKEEQRAQKKNQKHQAKKAPGRRKAKKDDWQSEMEESTVSGSDTDNDKFLPSKSTFKARPKPALNKKIDVPVPKKTTMVSGATNTITNYFAKDQVVASNTSHQVGVSSLVKSFPSGSKMNLDTKRSKNTKDETGMVSRKPALNKTAHAVSFAAKLKPKLGGDTDDDSFSDNEVPLIERLKNKQGQKSETFVSAQDTKKTKKRTSTKENDSVTSHFSDDDMDELDQGDFILASVTPAKDKRLKKVLKTAKSSKRARSDVAVPIVATKDNDHSSSDLDLNSTSLKGAATKKPTNNRFASRRTANKPVVYTMDSDSEGTFFACENGLSD